MKVPCVPVIELPEIPFKDDGEQATNEEMGIYQPVRYEPDVGPWTLFTSVFAKNRRDTSLQN